MKKLILALAIAPLTMYSQVFIEQDFENVEIGNFSETIDGTMWNDYGWVLIASNTTANATTTTTNADPSNFLVTFGETQELQITGPDATTGSRLAIPYGEAGFASFWEERDSGSDMLHVSFDGTAFIGNSYNNALLGIFDTTSYIGGVYINFTTGKLYGIAYIQGSNGAGAYLINFAEGGLDYVSGTTFDMDIYFNKVTGELTWISDSYGINGSIDTLKVGVDPNEVDFGLLAGTNNSAAGYFNIDNVLIEAINPETLSTHEFFAAAPLESMVYPNPAKETLNVSLAEDMSVDKVKLSIYNVAGKVLKQMNYSNSINISDLPSGVYMLTITDGSKTETKKFIKK